MAINKNLLDQMKREYNGCPLFEDREQGNFDDHLDETLTVTDYYSMSDYHVIIFEELPKLFFFSSGTLKQLFTRYEEEDLRGLRVIPKAKIKTVSRRDFRPFEII